MSCDGRAEGPATSSTWGTGSCRARRSSKSKPWRTTCTRSRCLAADSGSRMTAILLMAHGTPASLDEMPEYLTRVRGGRPPSPELVAEMRHNYGSIGGRSPLNDITLRQRNALRERLGPDVKVMVGMRNWHPFIADVLGALAGSGVTRVIGIPLAPQFS